MMSIRSAILALAIVALIAAPALGATATVVPNNVKIPIGGSNTTTLYITLTPTDYIGYIHYVYIKIYNSSTQQLSDKLNVSVVGYTTTKTGTGVYFYTFTPNASGNYSFTVVLSTNNSNPPVVGDSFTIDFSDLVVNTSLYPPVQLVAATYAGSNVVPELPTLALMALGLVGLAALFVKRAE